MVTRRSWSARSIRGGAGPRRGELVEQRPRRSTVRWSAARLGVSVGPGRHGVDDVGVGGSDDQERDVEHGAQRGRDVGD
jgi:hypothetical protein